MFSGRGFAFALTDQIIFRSSFQCINIFPLVQLLLLGYGCSHATFNGPGNPILYLFLVIFGLGIKYNIICSRESDEILSPINQFKDVYCVHNNHRHVHLDATHNFPDCYNIIAGNGCCESCYYVCSTLYN